MTPPDETTEVVETTADAGAGNAEGTTTSEETTETPETTEDVGSETQEDPSTGTEAAGETNEDGTPKVSVAESYKPTLKYKYSTFNKDLNDYEEKTGEIDKRFHSIIKSEEDEKAVRELYEKASGLDTVKERYNFTKQELNHTKQEYSQVTNQIQSLRQTYTKAVESGNWHKLDSFFSKMQIPQDHILKYALAKVQLNEMDPAQRQSVLNQLSAEDRAEQLAEARRMDSSSSEQTAKELNDLRLEVTLQRPEVNALASAFDDRMSRKDAFKEEVRREGTWAYANENKVLTPEQAVQRVIARYNLTTNPSLPGTKTGTTTASGKTIVKKPASTIPNISGAGSASPTKAKPKNLEEVKKIYQEKYGTENVS